MGSVFVFLNTQHSNGTALVDTAAQHGLVGIQTLEDHDHLLRSQFGLQVLWSHESGGTVRGVCGAEETTKIAYVPIGLGGKSGVLRVQVVPGDIPFLLPAYFLSDLGAVIDMKHATIMYMNLGIKQHMKRLHTGHGFSFYCGIWQWISSACEFCWRQKSSLVDRDHARLASSPSTACPTRDSDGSSGGACCCGSCTPFPCGAGKL